MQHGFFFGFTRNLSIFKAKTVKMRKRKLLCRFFFFSKLSLGFCFFNHGVCYIKTRAHAPNGQQHRMPGMPCLVEGFLQGSSGSLLQKCTVFIGKNFPMYLSR